jgi:predicted transcriptional regulator
MGIHKGTKLTDAPKNQMLRVRIDEVTAQKLEELAQRQKISKSEIIRKGIELQYGDKK